MDKCNANQIKQKVTNGTYVLQSWFKYLVSEFIADSTLFGRLVSHVLHHWYTALRKFLCTLQRVCLAKLFSISISELFTKPTQYTASQHGLVGSGAKLD